MCRLLILNALGLLLVTAPPVRGADFALRDGDTVVFLGDSITAARTYGKIIENYTLLRFPDRKVRFHNAGIGGDTAAGGLRRLERDVFSRHATVVTVAYGVNDIGWGLRADEGHKRTYLESIRGIVAACRKRGVRVWICSAAVTAADPARSEDSFLQKMCDEGMALSRSLGGQAIDVQRSMRGIQKTIWTANEKVADKAKHTTLHAADGVHLNDLGQLAMAYAILKGLDAPADVSAVTVDAREGKLVEASGCQVKEIKVEGDTVTFTRLDSGLPFNYGLFYALNFRFVPVPGELNRYLLAVKGLAKERYEVAADGRKLGTFTAQQLAAGVNISSSTSDPWQPGGPWSAQASVLQSLTDARHQFATAGVLAGAYLPGSAAAEALRRQSAKTDEDLVALQRAVARPQPYRFVVRPAEGKPEESREGRAGIVPGDPCQLAGR
jgi:lysophospholipase L1-like esterase